MDALMRSLENQSVEQAAKAPGQGHADVMRAIAEAHRKGRDKL